MRGNYSSLLLLDFVRHRSHAVWFYSGVGKAHRSRSASNGLRILLLAVFLILACLDFTFADEGMWLPNFLPDSVLTYMHETGLRLSQEQIFNSEGTGLANAVVRVGATGSFVSPEGLILTNHHVAFSAVQRISTPEKNYIDKGFLAKTRSEEIPALGYVIYVLRETHDVTNRVLSKVTEDMDPLERYYAVEQITKEIIAEAEAESDYHCEVDAFYGGAKYLLNMYEKITDVRVVYVPARAIGEYGGEIDNWMWPRHTGDFSFLRAYVGPDGKPRDYSEENVPYRPRSYLRISPEGLKEGEFTVIIGFPGRTHRYLTSHALRYYESCLYPERVRLLEKLIGILEDLSSSGVDLKVRLAATLKGFNNRIKNNMGMIEGFKRFDLVKIQSDFEARVAQDLSNSPDLSTRYQNLLNEFDSLYKERERTFRRDLLLEHLVGGWNLISQAMLIYKRSIEVKKPDMERDPDFMERNVDDLKRYLRVFQPSYSRQSDRAMMKLLIEELLDLPFDQQIEPLRKRFGHHDPNSRGQALDIFLDSLYRDTALESVEARLRFFEMAGEGIIETKDPMLAFAMELYPINEQRIESDKRFSGMLSKLEPDWINLITGGLLDSTYPDANGTMRLNCGVVRGYSPRDAVYYSPFTTLKGVLEKNKGEDPFDCPETLIQAAAHASQSRFFWSDLADIPVDLLTTNDSTGGNSGSPLINSRGELVGCLFDGNFESMTSDFRFIPDITRSISVDIRYILFVAEMVDSAYNILNELGVR
ncbi:MAG: S46 family peptidase [bacterium]